MSEKYAATFQQRKLILYEKLHPGETGYNMVQAVRLEGNVKKEKVIDAINRLYQNERILRIQYKEEKGKFYQVVIDPEKILFDCEEVDEETLKKRIEQEKRRPFKIFEERLIRCFMFSLPHDKYVLMIVIHHSVCDGWSLKVLFDKVIDFYMDKEPVKADDYIDYSLTQYETESKRKTDEEYWSKYLKEIDGMVDFPFDYQKSKDNSYEGGELKGKIPKNISVQIDSYCKKNKISPFIFLYGAYCYLLHTYTSQNTIVTGVPFANRLNQKWNKAIGYFVNVIPLKTEFNQSNPVRQYLKEIYLDMIHTISRTDVNLDVEYNMAFAFQSFDKMEETVIDQMKISPFKIHNERSKFDLQLSVQSDHGIYTYEWEYAKKLLREDTVAQLQCHYLNIIDNFLKDDEQNICDVEILTDQEIEQQKCDWNRTEKIYPITNLADLFHRSVKKYNKNAAVSYEGKTITYEELDQKSSSLAEILNRNAIKKGEIVAIQFERSLEMVISIYAIIKIGCAYLPIATDTPESRVRYMLENSGARALLRHKKATKTYNCLELGVEEEELTETGWKPTEVISPEDAAYVIYTSGSTGEPKGVINTHAGICNRLYWMQDEFVLQPKDTVLQKTPYTFDVSVWEFFWPLLFGGRLVVAKPDGHKDPEYLVDTIIKENVSFIHFVPSMLNIFIKNPRAGLCGNLKNVICSGEALSVDTVRDFYQKLNVPLSNLYGPTEAAVDVSCWRIKGYHQETSIPIGKPIANIKLYKLNTHMGFTPYNVPGELFISGIGLAKGYLNNQKLTEEKFIRTSMGRLYKTGDLVKLDERGNLIYLDRIDHQVKLNGQRIELGEIEERIKQFCGIEDAVVTVNKNPKGEKYLVGFFTGKSVINQEMLLSHLKNHLMEYMIPKIFLQIERIPVSSNGKTDKKALAELYKEQTKTVYAPPLNKIEEEIIRVFEEVLEIEKISREDDYFFIGGNSLRIADIINRLDDKFNLDISFELLLHNSRVKDLASQIERIIKKEETKTKQIDLLQEIKCDIKLDNIEIKSKSETPTIFLTGANGFLGTHLIRELLKDKKVKKLYCLIRADSDEAAWKKLISKMKSLEIWREEYRERIYLLPGDMTKENFGWKNSTVEMLKNEINIICHAGANVNFSIPYQNIKETNVNGTKEILKLFAEGIQKKLIYISTFSVFSDESYRRKLVREDVYPKDINNLTSGYVQSKMVCEHVLKKYQQQGADISIIRLGRIIGDQSIQIQNKDMLSSLLELCINMKAFPEINIEMDMLPVDLACKAIAFLMTKEDNIESVYHIINPNLLCLSRLGKALRENYSDVQIISWNEWYLKCESIAQKGDGLAKSVIILLNKHLETDVQEHQYNMRNAEDLYKKSKIYPPLQEKLINNMLKHGGNKNEQ